VHTYHIIYTQEAEGFYREAIAVAIASPSATTTGHILYTNLATVLFEQKKFDECVAAADQSLALDPAWLKAYFRKASALEAAADSSSSSSSAGGRGGDWTKTRARQVFEVWEAAREHCEMTPLLKKQHLVAKVQWLKVFKLQPVTSSADLLARYSLLTDSRQKLSTMAHFWNASNKVCIEGWVSG
jgi:tetratricopeptide (TPR) repeat protein